MLYRVKVTTNGTGHSYGERKRADAALLMAERLAFDVIAGQGGLDTQWGWDAIGKVRDIDPRKGATITIRDYVLFFTCSKS